MPCTPMLESASRTSSSLNGLMMAVTSFMRSPVSDSFADRKHDDAAAGVLELRARARGQLVGEAVEARVGHVAAALGAGVEIGGAEHPAGNVLGDADLPVGVVAVGGIGPRAPALELELAQVADDSPASAQVVGRAQVPVVRAFGPREREVIVDRMEVFERDPLPGAANVELLVVDLAGMNLGRVARVDE